MLVMLAAVVSESVLERGRMYDQYLFVLITGIFLVKAEEVIGVRLAVPAPQFWQQLLMATHNQILRQITF